MSGAASVVERILELTGRDPSLIEHVEDRKGHDRRYSVDISKISSEVHLSHILFGDVLAVRDVDLLVLAD